MMVSCSEDEPTSIKQGGYVTARINGVDFESVQVIGKLNTQPNQSLVIYAEDSHDDSNRRELGLSIGFSDFETIVTGIEYNDQQALPIVFHQYAKLVDGQYTEHANSTGTGSAILEFINIDRKKQQISGSFSFTGKDFFTSEEYRIAEGVFTGVDYHID